MKMAHYLSDLIPEVLGQSFDIQKGYGVHITGMKLSYRWLQLLIHMRVKALQTTLFNYSHYSEHGESHSQNIIKNIEMILGENRIKTLSPTDTWLLLMTAYLHDIGMIITADMLESKWKTTEFQEYIKTLSDASYDRDTREAASYLMDISSRISDEKGEIRSAIEDKDWALKVRKYVVQLTANYYRSQHASMSMEYLKKGKNPIDLSSQLLIPERLIKLAGGYSSESQSEF